jgi:hypothetical protein
MRRGWSYRRVGCDRGTNYGDGAGDCRAVGTSGTVVYRAQSSEPQDHSPGSTAAASCLRRSPARMSQTHSIPHSRLMAAGWQSIAISATGLPISGSWTLTEVCPPGSRSTRRSTSPPSGHPTTTVDHAPGWRTLGRPCPPLHRVARWAAFPDSHAQGSDGADHRHPELEAEAVNADRVGQVGRVGLVGRVGQVGRVGLVSAIALHAPMERASGRIRSD